MRRAYNRSRLYADTRQSLIDAEAKLGAPRSQGQTAYTAVRYTPYDGAPWNPINEKGDPEVAFSLLDSLTQ